MSGAAGRFLHTPKGKLVLALAAMVIVWSVILLSFLPDTQMILPSEEDMETLRAEVKKERAEFEAQNMKQRESDRLRQEYEEHLKEYWQEDRDGDVELGLRERIEQAAKNSGVKLASLGSVRKTKISNTLCFAELNISAADNIGAIAGLLAEIRRIKPVISWRRIDFRPENRPQNRPQQQNNAAKNNNQTQADRAKTTNAPAQAAPPEQQLRITGILRVICLTASEDHL